MKHLRPTSGHLYGAHRYPSGCVALPRGGHWRGFTLPELLVALLLSALLFSGGMRVLPALQAEILRSSAGLYATRDLDQLADKLGKILRRAGYCAGRCAGNGLVIDNASQCVVLAWDENHNGRWEREEYSGFRLRGGSIETRRGASDCRGSGWERISDPRSLRIRRWEVGLRARAGWSPRIEQAFSAQAVAGGRPVNPPLTLELSVSGFNL